MIQLRLWPRRYPWHPPHRLIAKLRAEHERGVVNGPQQINGRPIDFSRPWFVHGGGAW
jgi:hypothetical protein